MKIKKARDGSFKIRRTNTSGYPGVSWQKNAGKWSAHIRSGGIRYYLGLFDGVQEAFAAYIKKAKELAASNTAPDANTVRKSLLEAVRQHYAERGIEALSTPY